MKKKNKKCLFTWRKPDPKHLRQARRHFRQARSEYWKYRVMVVDSNNNKYNQWSVLTCDYASYKDINPFGKYWWECEHSCLTNWLENAIYDIEWERAYTGGLRVLPAFAFGMDAFCCSLIKKYIHMDALAIEQDWTVRERTRYWANIQREVCFPYLEKACNVRINPDGSGIFLDGIDHQLFQCGKQAIPTDKRILPEYNEMGERIRCKNALDWVINCETDGVAYYYEERGAVGSVFCFYDGWRRSRSGDKQVEIGSDEYFALLDRVCAFAKTRVDPAPNLVKFCLYS